MQKLRPIEEIDNELVAAEQALMTEPKNPILLRIANNRRAEKGLYWYRKMNCQIKLKVTADKYRAMESGKMVPVFGRKTKAYYLVDVARLKERVAAGKTKFVTKKVRRHR